MPRFFLTAVLRKLHWEKGKALEAFAPICMIIRTVNYANTVTEHNTPTQNIALA